MKKKVACNTKGFIKDLNDANVNTINFTDIYREHGTHRKALIIDQCKCIMGSRNLHKFYYEDISIDTTHFECDILIEDPFVCKQLSDILLTNRNNITKLSDTLTFVKNAPVETVDNFIEQTDVNIIENLINDKYIELINSTKQSLLIVVSTKYTYRVHRAITNACKCNVNVVIYANDNKQNGVIDDDYKYLFRNLLKFKNFSLYTNRSTHLLHRKYATFDDNKSCIGSFNFDDWSYSKNAEILLVIENDPNTAIKLRNETIDINSYFVKEDNIKLNFFQELYYKFFELHYRRDY